MCPISFAVLKYCQTNSNFDINTNGNRTDIADNNNSNNNICDAIIVNSIVNDINYEWRACERELYCPIGEDYTLEFECCRTGRTKQAHSGE